jgi:hypothetical protein
MKSAQMAVVQVRVTQGKLGEFTPDWLAVGSDNDDDETTTP